MTDSRTDNDVKPWIPPGKNIFTNLSSDHNGHTITIGGQTNVDINEVKFAVCRYPVCSETHQPDCYYVLKESEWEQFQQDYDAHFGNRDSLQQILNLVTDFKQGERVSQGRMDYDQFVRRCFGINERYTSWESSSESEAQKTKLGQEAEKSIKHLRELSVKFLEHHYYNEFTVYRWLQVSKTRLAEQLLNNPNKQTYKVSTPSAVVVTIHKPTAEHYSPLIFETEISSKDVILAPDNIQIYQDDKGSLTEGEVHLDGDKLIEIDRLELIAWEIDYPLAKLVAEMDVELSPEQHNAIATMINYLVTETDEGLKVHDEVSLSISAKNKINDWFDTVHDDMINYEVEPNNMFEQFSIEYLERVVTAITDTDRHV